MGKRRPAASLHLASQPADWSFMRLSRYAWVLAPLLAVGGLAFIGAIAECRSPGVWIGPRPETCDVHFLGLLLSRTAAGWIAALLGAALGAALAAVVYRQERHATS